MTHINRVVLTGLTGFIGSNLAAALLSRGIEVHAIVRTPQKTDSGSHGNLIKIYEYDGTTDSVLDAFESAKPDVVFHLASNFIAEHQPSDIAGLIGSNVLFGTQLLEAAARSGTPRFINTGSSWQHFGTTDHTSANLYAATKTAFENIVSYYAEAKQLNAISLIIFDTYGAGDTRRKLVPLLKNAWHSQQPLAMSPGDQKLDLVYIDDVIAAFMHAAELPENLSAGHKIYTISSGHPVSIKELVKRINQLVETPLEVIWGGRPYRAREVMHPWTRGTPLPGWKTIISLEEGLKKVFSS